MTSYPKNGLLSGMIITLSAAVMALIGGLFIPDVSVLFSEAPSPTLLNAFFVSICLLTVHKIESYLTREYDVCPVYLTNGQASWTQNNRQTIFLAFVPILLGMSFMLFLVMKGPPWPLLLLLIWISQGLHELHHSGKSLAQKKYYSGVISSLIFVLQIDFFLFPEWYAQLHMENEIAFYLYYALQPFVLLAFYLEHRRWRTALIEKGFRD